MVTAVELRSDAGLALSLRRVTSGQERRPIFSSSVFYLASFAPITPPPQNLTSVETRLTGPK